MSAIDQIEIEITSKSLLKHPFYQMWSKGELDREQISGYAKEYFQLVKVVPQMVRSVASKSTDSAASSSLEQNAREEEGHIELWTRFALSLGISRSELEAYSGSAKTRKAVTDLLDLVKNSNFREAASAMYAYEWELPKISRSKLDGLEKFYSLTSNDARIYFETHLEADVRHAATWREFLNSENNSTEENTVRAATQSIEAQNALLDSVMESYVTA